MSILQLPAPPADYKGGKEHCAVGGPIQIKYEAAGLSIEEFLKTMVGIDDSASDTSSIGGTPLSPYSPSSGKSAWGKDKEPRDRTQKKTVKLSEDELQGQHYDVLGLGDAGIAASDEQIKKAYKKLVVETHPDKTKGDDRKFKAVQMAFEVLADPMKKIAYDSALPFDDDIPSSKVDEKYFYEEFGECFEANSRWSTKKPVPQLGNKNTPIEEVDKFYEFWYAFKNWRDFSHVDEHNTEEAGDREEKRWMERENERERAKLSRLENKRIFALTDRGYKNDPRIKAHKEAEKKKRADEKAAIEAEKVRVQEEKERVVREAKEAEEKAAADATAEKKMWDKIHKDQMKKVRELVKKFVKPFILDQVTVKLADDSVCREDIDWFFAKLDFEKAQNMRWKFEEIAVQHETSVPTSTDACRKDVIAYVNKCIVEEELAGGQDRFGNMLKKVAAEKQDVSTDMGEWGDADVAKLKEALNTFGLGSEKRWANVAGHVGGKDINQILLKARELSNDLSELEKAERAKKDVEPASPVSGSSGWSKGQMKQFDDAMKMFKGLKDNAKWDKVTNAVQGKNKKEVQEYAKSKSGGGKKK